MPEKFKKGDRVETIPSKGPPVVGTVAKGGATRITVVVDGGKQEVRGHPSLFRPSKVPLPQDPAGGPMERYGVANYRSLGGEETDNFTAIILRDGEPFLHARNSGTGSGNLYYPVGLWTRKDEEEFHDAAKRWNALHGGPFDAESADMWMCWHLHERPYGVTSKMYLEEAAKEFAKLGLGAGK